MSVPSEQQISELIKLVRRQTDYDEAQAMEKLEQHNYIATHVIKEYMGVPIHKKQPEIKSMNQQIYKQLRHFMEDIEKTRQASRDTS